VNIAARTDLNRFSTSTTGEHTEINRPVLCVDADDIQDARDHRGQNPPHGVERTLNAS
jgi:hypothetical protein